ncbi:hypothetical protein [Marinimicrobium sp. C2-29]|uniref:hypothetical protein n=1 Tax=Marinimicrobium sp. C2-29 TaxID=3139825 RepID=UPI003139C1F1
MNIFKLIAIVVILAGTQGLLYGSYSHFNGDHQAAVDANEQQMLSDAAVTTQIWAGLGAMAAGSALFLYGVKHRRPSKRRQLVTLHRALPAPTSANSAPHSRTTDPTAS